MPCLHSLLLPTFSLPFSHFLFLNTWKNSYLNSRPCNLNNSSRNRSRKTPNNHYFLLTQTLYLLFITSQKNFAHPENFLPFH